MGILATKFNRPLSTDHSERRFGFRRPSFSSDRPAGAAEGDAFYELDTDKFFLWDGSNWVEMGRTGSWTTYTPATNNITIGAGSIGGRWTRMGRTIFASAQFNLGAGSAFTGRPGLGVPFNKVSGVDYIGMGFGLDAGIEEYTFGCRWSTDGIVEFLYPDISNVANGVVNSTFPFGWGNGDVLRLMAIYEAAASV